LTEILCWGVSRGSPEGTAHGPEIQHSFDKSIAKIYYKHKDERNNNRSNKRPTTSTFIGKKLTINSYFFAHIEI
jgi:hypothetical protein